MSLKPKHSFTRILFTLGIFGIFLWLGCSRQDMYDQARYEAFESSEFFPDSTSALHPPAGTVSRGNLYTPSPLHTGLKDGNPVKNIPMAIDSLDMEKGEEKYRIHCSPCHGRAGHGDGMVIKRGFPTPPSYHSQRLRMITDGYLFSVISQGRGKMFGFSEFLKPEDRWRVIAYIRALQVSQYANVEKLSKPVKHEVLKNMKASNQKKTGTSK